MAERSSPRPLTITEKTLLPAGIVLALLGMVSGATWWLAGISSRLDSIEKAIRESSKDVMTLRDFDVWVMSLRASHPDFSVPDRPH